MAGAVKNRIPNAAQTFRDGIDGLWISGQTMDSSPFSFTGDIERYDGVGSIEIPFYNMGLVSYQSLLFNFGGTSLTCITTEDDLNLPIEFSIWCKCNKPVTARMFLHFYDSSGNIVKEQYQDIYINSTDWVLLKTPQMTVDTSTQSYRIASRIQFNSDTNDVIAYLSSPVVIGVMDFANNSFASDVWLTKIPEFMRDEDRSSSQQFSLIKFLDVLTTAAGVIKDFVFAAAYVDESDGYSDDDDSSKSIFVDPSAADKIFLSYLSQFTGTKLINPRTGSTPWVNLPSTWMGIDNIDSVIDQQVPWGTVELYAPEPADFLNFIRWQTRYGYYGLNAGSKTAVVESVKRVLTGTKTINYSVTNPYEVTISTKIDETPNTFSLSVGDEVPEIVALIDPARPIGTLVKHVLIA